MLDSPKQDVIVNNFTNHFNSSTAPNYHTVNIRFIEKSKNKHIFSERKKDSKLL